MPAAAPIEVLDSDSEVYNSEAEDAAGPADPPPVRGGGGKRKRRNRVVAAPRKKKPAPKAPLEPAPKAPLEPAQTLEEHLAAIRALAAGDNDEQVRALKREREEERAEMQKLKRARVEERAELETLRTQRALLMDNLVNAHRRQEELRVMQLNLVDEVRDQVRQKTELQTALDLAPKPPQKNMIRDACSNCGDKDVLGLLCDTHAFDAHPICHDCLAQFASSDAAAMRMKRIGVDAYLPCASCTDDDRRNGINLGLALRDSVEPHTTSLLLAVENFARVDGRRAIHIESAQESRHFETPLQRVFDSIRAILENRVRGCGHLYADFEACMVVYCGAGDCSNVFCALCDMIILRNTDGHEHVRACAENPHPGNVFMNADEFKVFKKQQRRDRLDAFLATLDAVFITENAKEISQLVEHILE